MNFEHSASLVRHLGQAMGIELALNDKGEAAFKTSGGLIIVLRASPTDPVLVIEARQDGEVWTQDVSAAIGLLELNQRPQIGFAMVAADPFERSLFVRQPVLMGGLAHESFNTLVGNFLDVATSAFADVDRILKKQSMPTEAPDDRAFANPVGHLLRV